MPVILGTGVDRDEAVDDWATLPPRRKFDADVAAVGVARPDRLCTFNRGQHPIVVFNRDGNSLYPKGQLLPPALRSLQDRVKVR